VCYLHVSLSSLDFIIALCNHMGMNSGAPASCDPPATADPAAAAIARAERRLAMLGRLAELGMKLAEALTERAVSAPKDAEPRHDPAESFARVSRAVRLTLALEAKADQDLAALRDGAEAAPSEPKWPQPPFDDPWGLKKRDHPSAHRNKIRDNVWDVLDHEVEDVYLAQEVLDALHERLTEGERYDAFLHRPLRESVQAICGDLGLTPDWSRWTDDGFPPETRISRKDWASMWRPDPERAEERRERKAAALADQPPSPRPPDPHRRE
jgi:hypothetical protein